MTKAEQAEAARVRIEAAVERAAARLAKGDVSNVAVDPTDGSVHVKAPMGPEVPKANWE